MAQIEQPADGPAAPCPAASCPSSPVPELPRDAILVHIGLHKTGTTALQSVLASARDDLAARDIVYPAGGDAHHRAARSLLRRGTGSAPPSAPAWMRLAERAAANPGRTVISSEFLSQARPDDIRCLVDSLGGERVQILVGVRHYGPLALSAWQQGVKAGSVHGLEDWLKRNFWRGKDGRACGVYWDSQDAAATVRRWVEVVGAGRVCVVVIDETDRRLLPGTVERLLGLPDGLLAERTPARSNRGMSAAETELVRQVNVAVRGQLDWPEYALLIRHGMSRRLVEARARGADEPVAVLPEHASRLAVDEGTHAAADIRATGARIVGDLANLTLPLKVADRPEAAELPVAAGVAAVVGVLAGVLRGTWTLEAEPRPNKVLLAKVPTRTLADLVVARVRAGLRRRARRVLRRILHRPAARAQATEAAGTAQATQVPGAR